MKGLQKIPGMQELEKAYLLLQKKRSQEKGLALWSRWARLDPRLAELWVKNLSLYWKKLSPVELNVLLKKEPWPAAAGVLLEEVLANRLIPASERKQFRAWTRLVMSNVAPASGEAFFIGQRAFAGKLALKDAVRAEQSYLRWGYFGREALINDSESKENSSRESRKPILSHGVCTTRIPRTTRLRVLRDTFRRGQGFRVEDYIQALEGKVSRRVAELDLRDCAWIEAKGKTRARVYRAK